MLSTRLALSSRQSCALISAGVKRIPGFCKTTEGNIIRLSAPKALFSSSLPNRCSTSATEPVKKRYDCLFEKVDIEIRAHQPDVLKSYSWFATTAAKELEVTVSESWAEPEPHILRKTLLRSAFAHGKHRTQYEMRTYYHFIQLSRVTESSMNTFLEYIQRNLPEGVAMKVTKHERKPLPELILNAIKET